MEKKKNLPEQQDEVRKLWAKQKILANPRKN